MHFADRTGVLAAADCIADMPSARAGLTADEAALRLAEDGSNELPRTGHRTVFDIARGVAGEPMFALLIAAAAIYLVLGDLAEAVILGIFATISVAVAIVQEVRSERVLEALRDLTAPRALVVRSGVRVRIPGRDVVRGDLVVLSEGDRVPADGILIEAGDLAIDESLLTGESVPVAKRAAQHGGEVPSRPGGDGQPHVYSGTLVVRGQGLAVIRATGIRSEIGLIGQALGTIEAEPPRLTVQTRQLVRVMAIVGLALTILAAGLYWLWRGGVLAALLSGIALGMSMLPEEFPLVLTVFMVMGAWRISTVNVLTRRAAAIEALGAATVLCSDKTGTLTENRMSIAEVWAAGQRFRTVDTGARRLPDAAHGVVAHGVLASDPEPFDPMEKAFVECLAQDGRGAVASGLVPAGGFGIRPDLLAVTRLWRSPGSERLLVAAKGAPEAIARLGRLSPAERDELLRVAADMGSQGMRVLGVARATWPHASPPASPCDCAFEVLGLVGLADPLRPSVPSAVSECRSAGVRVVMITGDYPATALAIAREAGIAESAGESDGHVITGGELAGLSDEELRRRVRDVVVYARIMPEQKLRIVEALKANGEIVAMTGDGVNDAPSVKAAHIGIAMGRRGTDVAREASSIVLLDDDFGSIVKTARLGRRIYDNLRKAMGYVVAVHVPIAGLALLPLLFGTPIVLAPIHIAFLEMVIDPVCSVVFEAEPEEEDIMKRPPRDPESTLLSPALVGWYLLQGGLVLALVVAIYGLALARDVPEAEARALAFVSLVATNAGLIFVNRSHSASIWTALSRPNPWLWLVLGTVSAILLGTLFVPPLAALFKFSPMSAGELATALAAGVVVVVVLDLLKPLWAGRLRG